MTTSVARFLLSKSAYLLNEPIHVRLAHAFQYDKLTLTATISFNNIKFSSFGYYRSPKYYEKEDASPILDLNKHRCVGGTFSGIEPMGLFWSMIPDKGQREGVRLIVRDSREPMKITLKAFDGHLTDQEIKSQKPICEANANRTFLPDNVERVPIRVGKIRGTLFKPKNSAGKKFPAVLDLFGIAGGIMEQRAAFLASEGFVCLTMAFFQYDDLPKSLEFLDLDYFEESVDFLLNHPDVDGTSVGVIGISKGAEVAHQIAIHFGDKINGVISINGLAQFALIPIHYKGQIIQPELQNPPIDRMKKTEMGMSYKDVLEIIPPSDEFTTPLNKASKKAKFLFVHSNADLSCPHHQVDILADRLERVGLGKNVTIYRYPGAGHLLDVPYTPLCRQAYMKAFNLLVDFGGDTRDHALAQLDLWPKMIKFLRDAHH